MEEEKNKTVIDKIWDFFASVKLAIVIFAFIALTSVVGTILEQRAEPERNLQVLTRLFGESLAPNLYTIFDKLGFMDMYHSWWFTSLLVLFSVNLIICSFNRLPRIWKVIKDPVVPMTEERLKRFPVSREVVLKGKPDQVSGTVRGAIKGSFHFAEVAEERGYQFFSQKGKYSRLGVYITHMSILVILIGAVIGIWLGFKGYLNLPEGAAANAVYSDTEKEFSLDFQIICNKFNVEFYGRSDMPKEYKSWLTIIKNGREVLKKSIAVNDPLTYEGITFYQASYGLVPGDISRGVFIFKVISVDGKSSDINLRMGDNFQIPGTDITGKITDFSPALRFDESGQAFTYANQMNNPAVYVVFSEAGKPKFSGWIMRRYPETWQLPDGNRVEFLDVWGLQFTGLQVRKDPGVWIVYLGCITMSIGLFIAFFMSHRKIWVKVVEDKSNTRVIIGATTNKNRSALERKVDRMVSVLGKKQEGER